MLLCDSSDILAAMTVFLRKSKNVYLLDVDTLAHTQVRQLFSTIRMWPIMIYWDFTLYRIILFSARKSRRVIYHNVGLEVTECLKWQILLSSTHVSSCMICNFCTYVVRSHRRRVESQAPDRANCPSEEMTTSLTKWEWPLRERWGVP